MTASFDLRPYQREALEAVRTNYEAGIRRMLLVAATGGGKTVIFSHLADSVGLKPNDKVLILAHREELISQARDKYLRANPLEYVGIEKADQGRATPMDRVAIASVQTLKSERRMEDFLRRFGRPKLVITDESHHASSPSYQSIYKALGISSGSDVLHVGVTATPRRSDGVGLDGTFDKIVYSIGVDELIDQGYLVPLRGYTVNTSTNIDSVGTTAGDFNERALADAIDNDERNARVVSAFADLCPGRKAVVFASDVEHSMHLRDAFRSVGFKALHIDGAMRRDDRNESLQAFAAGEYQVVVNCAVLIEGWDEPTVDCVIIARPTKSSVLMTQMIGRGTRLNPPNKLDAIVIDMVDVTRKHSVVSLASLFGMPKNFNLQGRSVTAAAKKFQDMVAESPEMTTLVTNADELDAMTKLSAGERFNARMREFIATARATQSYIDVNLVRPPDLSDNVQQATSLNWVPSIDDSHLLRVDKDSVRIQKNLLGQFTVTATHLNDGQKVMDNLGTFSDEKDAFQIAESWVRQNHPDRMVLVDRNANWRNKPASEKQIKKLQSFRISVPPKMTSGEASNLLDRLFNSPKAKSA